MFLDVYGCHVRDVESEFLDVRHQGKLVTNEVGSTLAEEIVIGAIEGDLGGSVTRSIGPLVEVVSAPLIVRLPSSYGVDHQDGSIGGVIRDC